MSDNATQLIFEIHKGQSQFAYFQLGVAVSAIAFAIHDTTGVPLADVPWPLGLAVALWALSFALGCFGLDARQYGMQSNASFLQLSKEYAAYFAAPGMADVVKDITSDVKRDLKRPVRLFGWQKWVLFAGALAYIGGHVMQLAALPPRAAASTGAAIPTRTLVPSH